MERALLPYAEEFRQKKNHFFWPSLWKKAYFWLNNNDKGEVNYSGLQMINSRPFLIQKLNLTK
jgi:hypothetical protein